LIGIVDYGLGNLTSVQAAVKRLGYETIVTSDPCELNKADKLILPGVGAFGDGMRNLIQRNLVERLTDLAMNKAVPILGICLGFQLIAQESEEFGHNKGLGWVDAKVVRLKPADRALRVPHVGWNDLAQCGPSPLFDGVPEDSLFYYVHSYRMVAERDGLVVGECDYGGRFPAVVRQGNIHAVQFHPEKSQRHGLRLLENFLARA
jgi:glutamine amidotransferase